MDNPLPANHFFFLDILRPLEASDFVTLLLAGLIMALLIFCSGLVAGSENAFFSLPKSNIDEFGLDKTKTAKAITYLLGKPKTLLATILITNNFINIAFIIVSEWFFAQIFTEHILISTAYFVMQVVFVTFIIVFLAEVTPKIYATQNYLSFSKLMAVPMLYLSRFWRPFVWLLVKSTSIIDKRITRRGHELTVNDLEHAIDITTDTQAGSSEKEVLKNIVNFGNTDVKQIMRSRQDVKALEHDMKLEDVLKKINEWEYSRMPVYEESFDKVKGILNIKELLPHINQGPAFQWQNLIREPFYVPESKKIDDLLREFQTKRVHMAVVIDEYGGTAGIVTMEDILEEIFGEIHDEFDEDELYFSKLDENKFVFEGKTLINDMCRLMELPPDTFDPIRGETESLGGMLMEIAGRIPNLREKISWQQFEFTVEALDKRRIKRVVVSTM